MRGVFAAIATGALVAGFVVGSPLPAQGKDVPAIQIGDQYSPSVDRPSGPHREECSCDGNRAYRPRHRCVRIPDDLEGPNRHSKLASRISRWFARWSTVWIR